MRGFEQISRISLSYPCVMFACEDAPRTRLRGVEALWLFRTHNHHLNRKEEEGIGTQQRRGKMNIFRRSLGSSGGGSGGPGGHEGGFGRSGRLNLSERVIRIFVSLPEGSTLALPIDISSTIDQVRIEAVRRAVAIGIDIPRNSALRTAEGSHGVILFGGDLVVDALDLVVNHTFVLWSDVVSLRGS
jgi:hypothetical protein